MNLNDLVAWTKQTEKREILKGLVRKDAKGQPRDGDITVCTNLLKEIRTRVDFLNTHTKKVQKYEADIVEYLGTLRERGVAYNQQLDAVTTPGTTGGATGTMPPNPNPNPVIPMGSGQSSPSTAPMILPSLKNAKKKATEK